MKDEPTAELSRRKEKGFVGVKDVDLSNSSFGSNTRHEYKVHGCEQREGLQKLNSDFHAVVITTDPKQGVTEPALELENGPYVILRGNINQGLDRRTSARIEYRRREDYQTWTEVQKAEPKQDDLVLKLLS